MPSKAMTSSSSRPEERVMVFIDGSNLYHVLGQMCGRHDLQFDKFALKLANDRDMRRVYYYNIRQEAEGKPAAGAEQEKFLQSMYDTPYVEVKLGIWKQRGSTMVEKGVDVMLAVDLVRHAYTDHYDTAIVVSGDGDFYPAIQAVKDLGKHVEVAAFETNISAEAARVTDVYIKLTKTFFTGLWMTRSQARATAEARKRPEVTDEAASPNGEDKALTKTLRKPSTRRTGRTGTTRRTTARRPATPTATREEAVPAAPAPAAPEPVEARQPEPEKEAPRVPMRRTPSRRRVGGTLGSGTNGSAPRPPALRKTEPDTDE